MNTKYFLITAIVISLFTISGFTQMHGEMQKMTAKENVEKTVMDHYPLETCIVSGQNLGSMGEPVEIDHNGRTVKFCCQGCVDKFNDDPDKYLERLDKALIDAQKATYTATTCPVSGQKLGSMGEPVDYLHNNQLVRFCCSGCVDKFKADPQKYLKNLHSESMH